MRIEIIGDVYVREDQAKIMGWLYKGDEVDTVCLGDWCQIVVANTGAIISGGDAHLINLNARIAGPNSDDRLGIMRIFLSSAVIAMTQ